MSTNNPEAGVVRPEIDQSEVTTYKTDVDLLSSLVDDVDQPDFPEPTEFEDCCGPEGES